MMFNSETQQYIFNRERLVCLVKSVKIARCTGWRHAFSVLARIIKIVRCIHVADRHINLYLRVCIEDFYI